MLANWTKLTQYYFLARIFAQKKFGNMLMPCGQTSSLKNIARHRRMCKFCPIAEKHHNTERELTEKIRNTEQELIRTRYELEDTRARLEEAHQRLCLDTKLEEEISRLRSILRQNPPQRPKMPNLRRMRLAANQSWRCNLCEAVLSEAFHVDHIVPWAASFDDSDTNCQVLCYRCHLEKTSRENSSH